MSSFADDPIAYARDNDLVVVVPEDGELQIDIDDAASARHYTKMLTVLDNNGIAFAEEKRTTSRGGNTHIYANIAFDDAELDPVLRIAFQACLGSDRKRELLSLLRIMQKRFGTPTLFFETKEAA